MGTTPEGSSPRTLAEALRSRDDGELAALLRARPDLLSPVPSDLSQLATRAGTRASVVRALERLDRFALQTAEALAVAPDLAPYDALVALMAGDDGDEVVEAALPRAVALLRTQALVWGGDDRLRLVRTARELLAPSPSRPSPTGLGPTVGESTSGMSPGRIQQIITAAGLTTTHDPVSAVAGLTALFTDRDRMAALLDTAPSEALTVLDRLVWGPPYGEVTSNPTPPVRWLRDRGLLLPASPRTVVLPREVALHLRAGRAHRVPEPVPPAVRAAPSALGEGRPQLVDATAAGQALTALTAVEDLLQDWHEGGPAVLRAGGLSVRDLKRAAMALDTTEAMAAFWLELAYAAGLLASDGETDERYAPTPAYDEWLTLPSAGRWAQLAQAWLTSTRTSGLVGSLDGKGRSYSVLGPGLDRSATVETRLRVLELLAELPEGTAAAQDTLLARLRWERPLQAATAANTITSNNPADRASGPIDLRSRIAAWTLAEAESMGVTGRGALASHGRALLGASAAEHSGATQPTHQAEVAAVSAEAARKAAAVLTPLLPEPLDHVLLQADLTAVAPGPLKRPLAETLSVLADVESKGGATVYRFTPGSVRRALDAGRSASDLHAFLAAHSRTPVPQPLSYLIDDVARRHGHLRVGTASAYVRCDDEALLDEILADRRSQPLGLRRIAPTVLAAQAEAPVLLDALRTLGYAPAAESSEGAVLIARAHARRTPPRTPPAPVPDGPPVPNTTLLTAAVKAIRAGDLASTVALKPTPSEPAQQPASGELPRSTPAETLATVQAAAMTGSVVWIGYVNAEGSASQRVIAPVRVEGGFVTAYDHTADEVRTYPLHRITGVAELADDVS
ncbi:helicase-associated domain-containing protein [Streptomyces albipurpureus]|uniref:Helicase C-terminal domain-containing protein n=1 Tax=Streptomyces albipurpureus TaxID=2897419 RepID=A0ABT0UUB5_9ACTN|nr:helicase C-terminal domain-containing protein [Streptomyces sp. CWNU-1]MCM2391836.1 helicase C-terminal domain-containing protein [Streptomyces sp. CWNU-1]